MRLTRCAPLAVTLKQGDSLDTHFHNTCRPVFALYNLHLKHGKTRHVILDEDEIAMTASTPVSARTVTTRTGHRCTWGSGGTKFARDSCHCSTKRGENAALLRRLQMEHDGEGRGARGRQWCLRTALSEDGSTAVRVYLQGERGALVAHVSPHDVALYGENTTFHGGFPVSRSRAREMDPFTPGDQRVCT